MEGLVVGLKRKHPLETDEVDRPSVAIQRTHCSTVLGWTDTELETDLQQLAGVCYK